MSAHVEDMWRPCALAKPLRVAQNTTRNTTRNASQAANALAFSPKSIFSIDLDSRRLHMTTTQALNEDLSLRQRFGALSMAQKGQEKVKRSTSSVGGMSSVSSRTQVRFEALGVGHYT